MKEAEMLEQQGIYEIEYPSEINVMGPQWANVIDDVLSRAKGYYLMGYDIIWIYRSYSSSLQEMINQKTWRSGEAALFKVVLDRMYAQAIAVPQQEVEYELSR
jgi:hypothetical protein